jgi:hypothetical protein
MLQTTCERSSKLAGEMGAVVGASVGEGVAGRASVGLGRDVGLSCGGRLVAEGTEASVCSARCPGDGGGVDDGPQADSPQTRSADKMGIRFTGRPFREAQVSPSEL